MQVKKFEAKSMKEALEMVKTHLGPEAIILSAKDTHKGFGLMGEKSVEVTAAVSEATLRKRQIAELKLRDELRERFRQIPASQQKQFIQRANQQRELVTTAAEERAATTSTTKRPPSPPVSMEERAQLTGLRYIDIVDEPASSNSQPRRERRQPNPRVTQAAAAAATNIGNLTVPAAPSADNSAQVRALEAQVKELKELLERFQKVPQVSLNMHPGAEHGLNFEMSESYQRLLNQGVAAGIATNILRKAQREMDVDSKKRPALVDAFAVQQVMQGLDIAPQAASTRYHVFVGPTAQGKTTTLVKMAAQMMMKQKRTVALISMDTVKLGAADQLRLYAQILNVPFATLRHPSEWKAVEQKLQNVQHIFVDAPGFSLANAEELQWLRQMLPPSDLSRSLHYVQSVLARDDEAFSIAERYQALGLSDVIFTRLDEAARFGGIVNFVQRFKIPLHSLATGTRIPEDLEAATRERVVDLMFTLTSHRLKEEHP